MKAAHTMTMTGNNGERRSRSFNAHSNRVSSPSPVGRANYDYGHRDDDQVDFQSWRVLGAAPTAVEEARELERANLGGGGQRRQNSQPADTSTAPSSPRRVPDAHSSAAAAIFIRTSSLRVASRGKKEANHAPSREPRERSASARERRRAEFASYQYHERDYDAKLQFSPPTIVTTVDDISDDRFEDGEKGIYSSPQFLTVPGSYESPQSSDAEARSRSRSAPGKNEHKRLSQTRSDEQSESTSSSNSHDSTMHQRLYQHRSAETYDYDRRPVDRRVSYNPSREVASQETRATLRKYSCFEMPLNTDKNFLSAPAGGAAGPQQKLLGVTRSGSGSASVETPRRRFLPPTPDELAFRQHARKQSDPAENWENYLSAQPTTVCAPVANYANAKKPFLVSTSSPLTNSGGHDQRDELSPQVRRQLSSAGGCLSRDDDDGRSSCSTALEPTSSANKASTVQITADGVVTIPRSAITTSPRPGSGRKLPAEPTTLQLEANVAPVKMPLFRVSRQNAVGEETRLTKDGHSKIFSRQAANVSRTSSSEEGDASWPSPPETATPTPSSDASSKTAAATSHEVLKKFHQSSVSSSCSVPDFQIVAPPRVSISSNPGARAVDAATDSGHGSGAESGVGDGTAVSGSSSWPDAIVSGTTATPALLSLICADQSIENGSRRGSVLITPPLSPSAGSLGILHFTLQYFPVRKRLRVSVIKADLRMDAELNAFIKICLMPGKLQKQRGSRVVKRSKDAAFNEEFFFDNVSVDDIETKTVYMRLCNHIGKQFQKDMLIGQLESVLKDFAPILLGKQEVRMCQDLKPKQLKKLGRLQISTCLEKDARRLTINIFKADDLPKFGITGAPDPFVRITVDQNGWVQTKQSRVLKSTCNAVFKEAIMFLVSTKIADLERTKIIITVHDAARANSGDDAVGHVYLGQLASEKTEVEQWRNSVTHFGREFKATHLLKPESTAMNNEDSRERSSDEF